MMQVGVPVEEEKNREDSYGQFAQQRGTRSQPRTNESGGPAPGVASSNGQHSSGGSFGTYSYQTTQGVYRSRTQVNLMTNILSRITCPCHRS